MKRILIGYDGSPAANAAIEDLLAAGLPEKASALVLSVADVWLPPENSPSATGVQTSAAYRAARQKARQVFDQASELASRAAARLKAHFPNWTCEAEAAADSPSWAILQKASAWKPDLIVLGSHSHSVLERVFFGSVAQKVVAEAACSVRICRGPQASGPPVIVVAVDGSENSKDALREIANRSWPARTKFQLVSVVDASMETLLAGDGAASSYARAEDRSARDWVNRMAEDSARILFDAGLEVSNFIYEGDPKRVLVKVADDFKANAIFLGARGLHHGRKLSLGTLASAVVSRASCTVEVVRTAPEAGGK